MSLPSAACFCRFARNEARILDRAEAVGADAGAVRGRLGRRPRAVDETLRQRATRLYNDFRKIGDIIKSGNHPVGFWYDTLDDLNEDNHILDNSYNFDMSMCYLQIFQFFMNYETHFNAFFHLQSLFISCPFLTDLLT